MQIVVHDDARTAATHVANDIAHCLRLMPSAVLGLATGETMRPVYRHLRGLIDEGDVPAGQFTSFNLDEFIGVPASHPGSFHTYMLTELLGHIGDAKNRCFLPDGMAADPVAEAARYDAEIAMRGGIDFQLLGIGQNGHIGFNEPGTPLDSRTTLIELSEQTRNSLSAFGDDSPHRAITMGIGTIMEADRCLLLATGQAKASAVKAMVGGPVSTDCPASVLQEHPDAVIVLDRDAASLLTKGRG